MGWDENLENTRDEVEGQVKERFGQETGNEQTSDHEQMQNESSSEQGGSSYDQGDGSSEQGGSGYDQGDGSSEQGESSLGHSESSYDQGQEQDETGYPVD